nr:Meckelin [Polyrhizophydium stewartii]
MLGWNKATRYYTSSCSINLFNLVQSGYETYFYELFINQTAGGLYPVPLMRRFFVLDTASGVLNGKAAVIRVPASIVFTIRKAPETGKIMLPIVDITYTERETSSIALQDQSVYSTPQISFSLAYEQDYAYMRQVLTILFSISLSAGVIYAFYIARLWNSRNLGPYDSIDIYVRGLHRVLLLSAKALTPKLQFIMRLLLSIAGALGPIIGVFVFVLCMYFFVFYKLQSVMFVCLPHASTDTSMLSLAIAAVTVAEIAYIVRTLIRQCTTHIFFVDWERSKGRIVSSGNDPSAAQLAPVSVWRGIFMANQWNMLQTFQRVQIEFTLIVLLVLLEGLKLRNLAAPRPGFSDLSVDTPNPFLLLAVDCLCWLCLVVVQRAFHFLLFGRFYRNKLLQFIDLLSLANISLLIFDSPCHGYYIHGRSVHSYADTNMEELCNFLRKEENDMVPRRGLQDTNHQSFEVFVTLKMRSTFDKIFDQTTVQQPEVQRLNRMVNRLTVGEVRGGVLGDPIKPAADVQIQQYRQVNKFLRSFIDQNLKELPYAIREKTYFEQFVTSPDPSEGNVFFRSELGFAQTLLYGAESHMVLAYAYLFSYVDISCDSPALAAFVVWITHTALCFIRRHFGEINVSKKTLLDWKFLV